MKGLLSTVKWGECDASWLWSTLTVYILVLSIGIYGKNQHLNFWIFCTPFFEFDEWKCSVCVYLCVCVCVCVYVCLFIYLFIDFELPSKQESFKHILLYSKLYWALSCVLYTSRLIHVLKCITLAYKIFDTSSYITLNSLMMAQMGRNNLDIY